MRLLWRALAWVDAFWLWARGVRQPAGPPVTAGAGAHRGVGGEAESKGGVVWPPFPNLAHSFWRAQELTLFHRHREWLAAPFLDLGCGDGVFGKLAGFPSTGVGVDYDLDSLMSAERASEKFAWVRADAGRL